MSIHLFAASAVSSLRKRKRPLGTRVASHLHRRSAASSRAHTPITAGWSALKDAVHGNALVSNNSQAAIVVQQQLKPTAPILAPDKQLVANQQMEQVRRPSTPALGLAFR